MRYDYDIIVVGAGHAGCEAAAAAANLGSQTLLITMDLNKIAQMSCNPAIGGIAKGQIVREIDALGGYTGIVTDATAIQFRMLNRSKGPAMWSPRAQSDRRRFIDKWRSILENTPNLYMWQDTVSSLLVSGKSVCGVKTMLGVEFRARCVVITSGTFLNGLLHIGRTQIPGGRISEPASYGLTAQLVELGIPSGRMKTGTPVRIDGRSIDFSLAEEQGGESDFHKFSFLETPTRVLKQRSCWSIYTNEKVHDILREGFPDSPLYNGQIKSIGPRYCPSIETKLHTFPDKDKHQLFLEPEGEECNEYYLNGFSSSLPIDIQIRALRQIPALRNVQIYRPGYAIEYDYFEPEYLNHTLESKIVDSLFLAGQVNGTTGYEEAAGAYIGVLIDDLVTKGVDEPYRMFTSRAEYRILLRQDDADMRLTPKSRELSLASQQRFDMLESKRRNRDCLIEFCRNYSVKAEYINAGLERLGTTPLKQGVKLIDLILRPQITIYDVAELIPRLKREIEKIADRREETVEAAEILMKYEGYIERERLIADKISRLENIRIKGKFDYSTITQLTIEARQKLARIDPETIAQAGRIPGISPSDINILLLLLGR